MVIGLLAVFLFGAVVVGYYMWMSLNDDGYTIEDELGDSDEE